MKIKIIFLALIVLSMLSLSVMAGTPIDNKLQSSTKLILTQEYVLIQDDLTVNSTVDENGTIDTPEEIYCYDSKNKKIKFKDKNEKDGDKDKKVKMPKDPNCKDKTIHIGPTSDILELQDITVLQTASSEVKASLFHQNNDIAQGVYWVINESNKFGSNVTNITSELRSFYYNLDSELEIVENSGIYYFKEGLVGHKIDFSDICELQNASNEYYSECSYTVSSYYDNSTQKDMNRLRLDFKSYGEIDPVFSQEILDTNSLFSNTRFESGNYTHLVTDHPNLVFYAPFDADNANNAYDYGPDDHDGTTFVSPSYNSTGGFYGGAYEFNHSSNQRIGFGKVLPTNDESYENFTASAWVNFNADNSGFNQVIFGQFTASSGANGTKGNFIIRELGGTGGTVRAHVWDVNTSDPRSMDSNITLPINSWTHITLVSANNGTSLEMFFNGTSVGTGGGSTANFGDFGGYDFVVGGLANQGFNGTIDEVMIFNTSLNSTEVNTIYNATIERFPVSGTVTNKFLSFNSSNNKVTLSLSDYQRLQSTDIEARVGYWKLSDGYNNTGTNLVAYYHADGDAVDVAQNNNGTFNGNANATANGTFGTAFGFDGIGDYITTSGNPNLNFSNDNFSYGAWISSTRDTGAQQFLFGRGTPASNSPYFAWLQDDQVRFLVGNSSCDGWLTSADLVYVFTPNEVTHIFFTKEGSDIKLYADGVEHDSFTMGSDTICQDGSTFSIGSSYTGVSPLNGTVDELMVFNKTLSPTEVKQLYVEGRATWNYTAYQSLSDLNSTHSENTFDVDLGTTNILPEYKLESDPTNNFYSSEISITSSGEFFNGPPIIDSITLNATDSPLNTTNANLTGYINASDADGNNISLVYNWYVNGTVKGKTTFTEGKSLLAYYPLNNDTKDYFGVYDGTVGGDAASTYPGRIAGAYQFDGDGDFIDVSTINIASASNITLSAWIKPNLASSSQQVALMIGDSFVLGVDGGENRTWVAQPGVGNHYGTTGALQSDEWAHLSATLDGTIIKVFLNGQLHDTIAFTSAHDGGALLIGKRDTNVQYWNGSLDEMQVYNSLLSASEIEQIYVAGVFGADGLGGTVMNSSETNTGDNWTLGAIACDSLDCGSELNSTVLTILSTGNAAPVVDNIVLNATDNPLNTTDANLTGFVNASDADGDNVTTVYNWYKNDVLNATSLLENDADLLAYWPFNNDTLDYAGDNDGTFGGNAFINETFGQLEGSLDLDGVDDYVTHGDVLDLGLNDMSISAWIRSEGIGANQVIVAKRFSSFGVGYDFKIASSQATLDLINTTDFIAASGSSTLVSDTWYHLVAVIDKDNNITIYVNGLNDGTTNIAGTGWDTLDVTNSQPLLTGINTAPGSADFNGVIDEVQVYNRTLTESEVQQLYYGSVYGGDVMDSSRTDNGDVWKLGAIGCDSTDCGDESNSSTVTILDIVDPTVTFILPTQNNIYGFITLIDVDITDETAIVNTNYSVINLTGSVLDSFNLTGPGYTDNLNTSVYPDGNYTLTAFAEDSFGNVGNSSVNITLDNTNPNIQIYNPLNGSTQTGNFSINISYQNALLNETRYNITNSSGDVVASGINSSVNSSSFSFTDFIDVTSWVDGIYQLFAWALDSIGLTTQTNVTFTLNTQEIPSVDSITLLATDDPLNTSSANLTITAVASDPEGDNITLVYDWYLNGTLNASTVFIQDSGLISYWSLNNDTKDYGGTSDGVISGSGVINATDGVIEGSADLSGGSINFTDNRDPRYNTSDWTVSMWVKTNAENNPSILFQNIDTASSGDCGWAIQYDRSSSGCPNNAICVLQSASCGSFDLDWSAITNPLVPGEWEHLVFTWDNSTLTTRFYSNNVLIDTEVETKSAVFSSNMEMFIGGGFPGLEFDGSIDEVQVYDRPLNATEISLLYYGSTYVTVLNSSQTEVGDVWTAGAIACDPMDCSSQLNSSITILANATPGTTPVINSIVLNATDHPLNLTTANLTGFVNASDPQGDNITLLYDWYKNNTLDATSFIESGAVLYLPFNNDSYDYSSDNIGVSDGAIKNNTDGVVGTSYTFNGVDSVINVTDTGSLNISTGDFTLSAWIKTSTSGAVQHIAGKLEAGAGSPGYTISVQPSGRFGYFVRNGGSLGGTDDAALVDDGQWHHVVTVFDRSGDAVRYVDGVPSGTNDSMSGVTGTFVNDYIFTVGLLSPGDAQAFDGNIDEVMMWNRTLSSSEITQLYYGSVYGGDVMDSSKTTVNDEWVLGSKACDSENCSEESNSSTLTILSATDAIAPQYSGLTENPVDPATYSSGQLYEFNSTWTDNVAVDTVIIDFDGTNYTVTGGPVYNFTINDLSAGTHNYTWYANDTSGNNNETTLQTYTISQAVPSGSLSGTTPITYGTAGDVLGSESNTGDSDVVYNLYRNGTLVSNPDTTILAAGTYLYVYNTTGGQNYTSNSSLDTFSLTVNKASTTSDLLLNGVADNLTITYPSQVNASASGVNGTIVLLRNGSDVTGQNNLFQDLAAGTYNFTAQIAANNNYTASSVTYFATINQASNTCTLTTNSPVTYLANVTASGSCNTSSNIYQNGSLVSSPFNELLGVGTYNFTLNSTGNENYTSGQDSELVIVNQATTVLSLNFSPSNSELNGTETNVTGFGCPVQLNCSLYRNGTLIIGDSDIQNLSVGVYTYVYNTSGNANYSSDSVTGNLTINVVVPPSTSTSSGSSRGIRCGPGEVLANGVCVDFVQDFAPVEEDLSLLNNVIFDFNIPVFGTIGAVPEITGNKLIEITFKNALFLFALIVLSFVFLIILDYTKGMLSKDKYNSLVKFAWVSVLFILVWWLDLSNFILFEFNSLVFNLGDLLLIVFGIYSIVLVVKFIFNK